MNEFYNVPFGMFETKKESELKNFTETLLLQ